MTAHLDADPLQMTPSSPQPTLTLLRSIFDGAPDAIIITARSGLIVLANPAASGLFGYGTEELCGLPVDRLVPEVMRDRHARHRTEFESHPFNRTMGAGRNLLACRKDGHLVPVDISLTKVDLAEGSFVIAIARDVTVYRRFLEACPVAIFVCEDDRVAYANPAAFALVGAREGTLAGSSLSDALHPDDREEFARRVAEAFEHDEPAASLPITIRILRGDGEVRHVETASVAVPNAAVATTISAMLDVTERIRAAERERSLEVELVKQRRMADIGVVTTQVVHDIANPIAGLIMSTQRALQLLDRMPPELVRPVRPNLERVLTTSSHLQTLLGEFKDFSRQQRLEFEDLALGSFLGEIKDSWAEEAAAHGIRLSVAGASVTIRADRSRLRRAFDNLVKNALEAIDQGPGMIDIATAPVDGGSVVVTIADSGPGVPPGTNPFALFETTKPNGTGLGLPSVKQVVEAHGGKVELVSGPGQGAAFRVVLPASRLPLSAVPRG